MKSFVLVILTFLFLPFYVSAQDGFVDEYSPMTNEKLGELVKLGADSVSGNLGNWQILYHKRLVMILTDQNANRMRIMSPIVEIDKIDAVHFKAMMEANFDRALDAKYATYDQIVWSVYTHPLKELHPHQFKEALLQVITLVDNFGGSYTSTNFVFGSGN